MDSCLVTHLHDVGEDACGGHASTCTIAANHHWIVVVAFGSDKNDIVGPLQWVEWVIDRAVLPG